MRQGQQNRRGRGRNNNNNNNNQNRKGQHHHNPLMRTYQSNGPDQKIHGTPAQIAEKYMSLARDALSSGDHVLAENYLQHAEHYNRIILTYREQQMQQGGDMNGGAGGRPRPFPGSEGYESGEDDDRDDLPGEGGQPSGMAGQPGGYSGGQAGGQQGAMRPREQQHQPRGGFEHQGRGEDRPRNQGEGFRDRDRDRQFRPRDPRFQQDRDRGDRFRPRDGDRPERDQRADRPERDQRDQRDHRPDRDPRDQRPERDQRPDRPDRGERPIRQAFEPRGEAADRAPPALERDRGFEPPPVINGEPAAPQADPPPPRRRERFTEPPADQPEFLRRSVRRPRREAPAETAAEPAPAAPRRDIDDGVAD